MAIPTNPLTACWDYVGVLTVPVVNLEVKEVKDIVWEKLQEPKSQRKLVLVIVSIALLLDNMLYMVIVPIIPDYLRYIGAWGEEEARLAHNLSLQGKPRHHAHHGQDSATGILFASKAIVQLMVNPFSGALIDRIGYDIPMMIGLTIMFLSTAVFACGRSYSLLFFARSLQGVGSAFADTAGLAMIADRFTEENERSKALGIALAFISFGCLVAPPFGGALYQFAGKEMPFLILAFVSLADGFMLLIVMKPFKTQLKEMREYDASTKAGVPIWQLFMDPYIAVCSGALMMSNVALAFLEPTISLWMEDNLTTENWKIGMIWLPAFFPHVFGVVLTVKMARKYPQYQWVMAAGGLALEGLCCFIIPFSSSYKMLMIPICGICFGIALIDTALLPTLGYLVDVRHVSVYGSIYAIADISYSLAYAIGPIIAGGVVEAIGFTALNFGIAFSNLLYAPVLYYLRNIYDFKPFENEANILMSDPPDKQYQTYTMQDQQPVQGDFKNHLEYTKHQEQDNGYSMQDGGMEETNLDRQAGDHDQYNYRQPEQQQYRHQQQQQGYQQQDYQQQGYQQQNVPRQPDFQAPSRPPPPGSQGWLSTLSRKVFSSANQDDLNGNGAQCELPKLPVPDLETTMQRYLDTLKPIVTERQLEHTRLLVQSFMEGPGPTVQDALLQRRSRMDNWAYDWWLDDMYLAQPLCLPINVNPGMLFPPQDIKSNNDIALLAARVITNVAQFKDKLDRRALPVERATSREKGQPLCMAQFYRLLTSYRVPGNVKDTIYNSEPDAPSPNQHIIIACRNQFYALQLKSKDKSDGLVEEEIASNIMSILNSPASNITTPPVGILTTQRRDIWAESRDLLRQDTQNVKSLELIENCLMILCLDMTPMTHQFNRRSGPEGLPGHRIGVRDETNISHQMLHGGGSAFNSNNRWFDKTIQIIIGSDGAFGICCEHSPAEAIAVVQLTEQILESCKDLSLGKIREDIPEASDHLQQLQWTIQPALKKHIREASQSLNNLVEDLDMYIYRFAGYGKNFIKKCAVSPDAYIQLALQLTYHKMYGRLTSTYESASTRRFLLGRVDCIRSASAEAAEWTAAMNQVSDQVSTDPLQPGKRVTFNLFSEKEKLGLFDAAVKKQTEIMIENILGDGIDIHLLGLREQSKLLDQPMDLFRDECYRIANHFALSTSQVPTTSNCVLGYGPVVPDGYGCCYNPWPDSITFCISAFHSSESTKSSMFAQNLEESLLAMQELLQSRGT